MPAPNLGYGQRGDVAIDAFNQWFRAQPQYAQKIASFGQSPNNVHLNDDQKQEMVRLAQSLGAVVDEGHDGQEVDDSGNFRAKSHTMRNIAIIGGIAAATLLTAGAAGAFAGGAATAGGGAAAGGVEAGVTAGLGTSALPGAMATLPAMGGTTAAAAGGVGTLEGLGWGGGEAASSGTGAAAAGDGMDLASTWGPGATELSGTFQGPSTVSDLGGSVFSRLASKYGPRVVSEVISGYLGQKNESQRLDAAAEARNQQTALAESNLDPFRGYMAQARDVGKLDMQAEGDFSSSPVQTDAKYGKGLNVQPEQFYTPSTMMRTVARGARANVAAGNTAPTMTDPANYGQVPVYHAGAEPDPAAAVDPAGSPATALLAALRKKGIVTDETNPTSPWLAR